MNSLNNSLIIHPDKYSLSNEAETKIVVVDKSKENTNDNYNFDEILDKIKKQFHTIDNNDVINIYIDETNDNHNLQSISDHKDYEVKDYEVKNSNESFTPQNDETSSEVNSSPLPELLRSASIYRRKESLWTEDLEEEIKNFSKLCEAEAEKCGRKAKKNFYIGRGLQIALILLGSISVYSSASSFEMDIKNAISLFSGFSTTVVSSIYTLFGFTKKSTISFETSLGLYSLAMMIKCELLKPTRIRKSPFELMHFCTMTHDKLMKKIGVDDF
jgi:TusA-related sulfurtransferase